MKTRNTPYVNAYIGKYGGHIYLAFPRYGGKVQNADRLKQLMLY